MAVSFALPNIKLLIHCYLMVSMIFLWSGSLLLRFYSVVEERMASAIIQSDIKSNI